MPPPQYLVQGGLEMETSMVVLSELGECPAVSLGTQSSFQSCLGLKSTVLLAMVPATVEVNSHGCSPLAASSHPRLFHLPLNPVGVGRKI